MATAFYTHPDCKLHEMGALHPECPERLAAIQDQIIASRISDALVYREAPLAGEAVLASVHTPAYINTIKRYAACAATARVEIDSDTSMNAYTWRAALRASGAALAATEAVLAGHYDNAFCCVRPPGHHAEPARAMGFCFFNNIALAARHALDVHGLARVAIIDFDVHHGNGTEAVFAHENRVLMCGFFQHPLYPFSGVPGSSPNMVNLPLPARTTGLAMREAFNKGCWPRLNAFKPEMIFVSAGFDAHREDLISGMGLVEADYAWLTERISEIAQRYAQGRIVSCLEGGYNLSALGRSAVTHVRGLAGL